MYDGSTPYLYRSYLTFSDSVVVKYLCSEFKKGILVLQVPCLSHSCFLCDEKKKRKKNITDNIYENMTSGTGELPQVRESKSWTLDSTPWIPDSRYWIPAFDSGTWISHSGFWIPNPRIPDSISKNFSDSRIQIPFFGVSVANKLTKNLFISLSLIIHLFIKFLQKRRINTWYPKYKDCIYSIKHCGDYQIFPISDLSNAAFISNHISYITKSFSKSFVNVM